MFPRSSFSRIQIAPVGQDAESNIRLRYVIERAGWLWHPDHDGDRPMLARFALDFTVNETVKTPLHVSADERFILQLDGELLGRGPDLSDPAHWAFQTYDVELGPGAHRFEVIVTWLGDVGPYAQMSLRPGFILAMDALPELDTGTADWQVAEIQGVSCGPGLANAFHVIGPSYRLDAARWFAAPDWRPPTIHRSIWRGLGTRMSGHRLHPAVLPEQIWAPRSLGRVRAARRVSATDQAWTEVGNEAAVNAWQALVDGTAPLHVPPGENWEVLCDFEDYVCGYPFVHWRGAAAELQWDWAESLYLDPPPAVRGKGCRNDIAGKYFHGFGDTFVAAGENGEQFTPWWRAGRFLRLRLQSGNEGAEITSLAVAETRYDASQHLEIEVPDAGLQAGLPIMLRVLEVGHHEVFCDSPYYEQLMYTGDAHVRLLCEYPVNHDTASARHAIALFDWSRRECDWVASRYPSRFFQLIPIYSLSWIFILRDYAWWRDDAATVRSALPGMRATLDLWLEQRTRTGLVDRPAGWNILDCVAGWEEGEPPGLGAGGSTSINLFLLMALRIAVQLEEAHGFPQRAAVWSEEAERLRAALASQRWNPSSALWHESPAGDCSEHAQALAVLADVLPPAESARAFAAWQENLPSFPRTNLYFEFFVFSALVQAGRADLMQVRLEPWRQFHGKGFVTTPEFREDETRSDCHAWSAHPIYHLVSGVAGIRPDAPGFARVLIAPQPGEWPQLRMRVCHPQGFVAVDLKFDSAGGVTGTVNLPPGITGCFVWRDTELALPAGSTTLCLPPGVPRIQSTTPLS